VNLYNMLFGMNSKSDLLLAVIGLKRHDVERFRDCDASDDGSEITVYTRTGGGNRDDYPNTVLRHAPGWTRSEDDDFDSTYCTDYFAVPGRWHRDVVALGDPLANGLRAGFAKHLAATLRRDPTEADKEHAAYESERSELSRLKHFMANGHTFVPLDDYAAEKALALAEANGGSLRSCWGIAPLMLVVRTSFQPYPKHADAWRRAGIVRAQIDYDHQWKMDDAYWEHMERFSEKYPLAMAKVRETVEAYNTKAAR